jgi:hypothetical protein
MSLLSISGINRYVLTRMTQLGTTNKACSNRINLTRTTSGQVHNSRAILDPGNHRRLVIPFRGTRTAMHTAKVHATLTIRNTVPTAVVGVATASRTRKTTSAKVASRMAIISTLTLIRAAGLTMTCGSTTNSSAQERRTKPIERTFISAHLLPGPRSAEHYRYLSPYILIILYHSISLFQISSYCLMLLYSRVDHLGAQAHKACIDERTE